MSHNPVRGAAGNMEGSAFSFQVLINYMYSEIGIYTVLQNNQKHLFQSSSGDIVFKTKLLK